MSLPLSICVCILVAITAFCGQINAQGSKTCQILLDCVKDVQKEQERCETQFPKNSTAEKNGKNGCNDPELRGQLKKKNAEQKQQYVDCLQSRISQAYEVGFDKKKKQEKCQAAISNYQNPGNDNSNNVQDGNGNRQRRATDDENNDNGNGASGKGKSDSTNINNKGKGKGKGKGKKTATPQQQCQKNAQQKYKKCKALADCCSETQICHLKFELSTLHDDIRKIQLDLATKRHDCEQKKSQSNDGVASKQTVLRDDPIADGQSEEQNDQTDFNVKEDLEKFDLSNEMDNDDM